MLQREFSLGMPSTIGKQILLSPALEQGCPVVSATIIQQHRRSIGPQFEPQHRTPLTALSCASDEDDDGSERRVFQTQKKLTQTILDLRVLSRPPRRPIEVTKVLQVATLLPRAV